MPVTGTANLPVADRNTPWDGPAAKRRVMEACGDVACIRRAFLWQSPDSDARTQAAWSLGFADIIDGRLHIIPRGVAAAAGGRGVGAAAVPDEDKARIRARICTIYTRVRSMFDDWPECPFDSETASADEVVTADASGDAIEGVIAVEGQDTGDGRRFAKGAFYWEEELLPLPLVYDGENMDHTGRVVGTVNAIERRGDEIVAVGNLSDSDDPDTQAAVGRVRELLAEGAVGVSVAYDSDEWEEPDANGVEETKRARIRHVAIVDLPAIAQAKMMLAASCAPIVAAAPPEWFADPGFGEDDDERLVWQEPERPEEERQLGAPLTVTEDGRIWGHAALWGRCHVGYPGTCVRPPKEPASYRGFLTGERCTGVPTGPIVMRTIHAPMHVNAAAAQSHYDHTGYAVGDVTIGADRYGIWVAGAVRPDASPQDIEILRGSALSGDWRVIGGRHRLIGILAVSAPGFRVARAVAASGALITTGPGCDICEDQLPLEDRVAELERTIAAMTA